VGVDFSIRRFFAPARIWRLRRLFERAQYWAPDRLRAWQDERLAEVVRAAYERVPYWRDLFDAHGLKPHDVRTVADLAKLPPLTKDDVRRAGRRLWSEKGRHRFRVVTTSGTTGTPLRIAVDQAANAQEFVYYWRYWGWAGYRLGDRFAMFSPYLFFRDEGLAQRAWHWQPMFRRLMLNPVALTPERVRDVVGGLRRYRPRFLKGHAADLYLLAVLLRQHGIRDIAFKALFPTAEMLLPRCREVMETTFGCRALDSYGHMERVVAVCQCEHGRYHINADYGVLQIEDVRPRGPGGRPMGRVVGSSLHNRAMPLLRYETGDLIEPVEAPASCPCGRTLPVVRAIHGRQEDVIVTPDGRVVTALYNLWQDVPAVEFGQVERDGADHLTAFVVPGPDYGPADERRLAHLLAQFLGPSMRFDIRHITRDAIRRTPNGKVRLVIGGVSPLQAAGCGDGNA